MTTGRTTIHVGDALAVLQTLPAESVQCIVTSPPYYGLRSYAPDMVKLRGNLTADEMVAVLTEMTRLGIIPSNRG